MIRQEEADSIARKIMEDNTLSMSEQMALLTELEKFVD